MIGKIIDADVLKKKIQKKCETCTAKERIDCKDCSINSYIKDIDEAPAIDLGKVLDDAYKMGYIKSSLDNMKK